MKLGQPDMMMSPSDMGAAPNKEPYYPSISIDHPSAPKIPNKGTATVKYHVGSRSSHTKGKKTHHSAKVHIHSFAPMGGMRAPTDEEAIEKALGQAEDETPGSPGSDEPAGG